MENDETRAGWDEWLRPPAAAAYTKLSLSTLAKKRLYGDGPEYTKAGPRVVLYRRSALDAWLEARMRRSTSDAMEGVR